MRVVSRPTDKASIQGKGSDGLVLEVGSATLGGSGLLTIDSLGCVKGEAAQAIQVCAMRVQSCRLQELSPVRENVVQARRRCPVQLNTAHPALRNVHAAYIVPAISITCIIWQGESRAGHAAGALSNLVFVQRRPITCVLLEWPD